MVQGVGGTGSSGSLQNISAYQVYYPLYEQYLQNNSSETQLDFEAWLVMKGYIKNFNQQVENYIETGDGKRDDASKNTIDGNKHLSNSTGAIYQSEDEDTYYEFDWKSGTYRTLTGNKEVAQALGMPDGQNIDRISFGYMNANIIDYTFGNLDDGQDSSVRNVYGNYGNVSYTNQEFDIDYILNSLLMDPNDPQYQIAKGIFDDLCNNTKQWLPDSAMDELNEVAAEYGTNSAEYKAKLKEVLLDNLDQAQEWVDDHTHVKNTGLGSLGSVEDTTETGGTDGSENGESITGEVPDYDMSSVLNGAGILSDYTNNTIWKSGKVNRSDKSQEECRSQALAKSAAYASEVLEQVANTLVSQLGDQCTDEIQKYIAKAKQAALEDKSWQDTQWHSAVLNKNKGFTSTCEVKTLVDKFFNEFNTLCTNKGKTSQEVAAEQKAAEEKAAREKSAYQSLYNTDMLSTAKDAGVDTDKDLQVVNVNSAAEIKSKAESEILNPIKNKIKSQLAGKGISSSDLETILNNAANSVLTDCTDWASTSNNYVYNIDTDKLISQFETEVKKAVKAKGYDF